MPMATDPRPIDRELDVSITVDLPQRVTLEGKHCILEPIAEKHFDDLYKNIGTFTPVWDYMPFGPYDNDREGFDDQMRKHILSTDPLFFSVVRKDTKECVGYLSFLRIDQPNRVVEVGHVTFSPSLQRTTISTDAQYTLAKYAMDTLGYRRYEWKCHNMNAPSKRAAIRLGFLAEGVFRNHMIFKGRNRDTAWFAWTEEDWQKVVKPSFEKYFDGANFNPDGTQKCSLSEIRNQIVKQIGYQPYL